MDHQSKMRENERLIKNYDAFLPECGNYDHRLKLCTEIGRLNEQNKRIRKMTVENSKHKVHRYSLEVPAML